VIYRLFAVLTFVAVIVASILLARQQGVTPSATTVQGSAWDEGYSAQGARLVETGANGLPLYTLNATTIRQLPNEGQVQLTQVQMSFRDPDGNPWTATADHGELEQPGGQVQLLGNVHVSGILGSEPAQITTAALWVDIHSDIVSTRDPVQMLWAGRQLTSTGLSADLKDDRVHLEFAVHGTFSKYSLPPPLSSARAAGSAR
jgi:LPS export ABC transporter protein LptC